MVDGHIDCNGVSVYYRKTGAGKPLIFLHGNGEDGTLFAPIAKRLQEYFCVYLPDARGHGQSTDAPLHYCDMAEDTAEFIRGLKLDSPLVYGFSDGGIVALILAMRYPDLVSRLAVSGVNLSPRALKRRVRFCIAVAHVFTRDEKLRLMLREPDIPFKDLEAITTPVWITAGEHDIVPASHTKQIAAAIKDARLKILENENHFSYVKDNEKLYDCLCDFLFFEQ